MQIVKAITDCRVCDRQNQLAYQLRVGESYVLHDEEAGLGLRDGAIELVEGLDRQLPHYRGQALSHERLLLAFIGRGGDALVVASCLEALLEAYPDISIDISCREEAKAVFSLSPHIANLMAYPPSADAIDRYGYYMCFEGIESISKGHSLSCRTVFTACLHTPPTKKPGTIVVPSAHQDQWQLPEFSGETVGLAMGRRDSLRSYPLTACKELADLLVSAGYRVYLLGGDDPDRDCIRELFPQALHVAHAEDLRGLPPTSAMIDLVGSTPAPADLAAVIAQLDMIITSDSFPMHLSGSLGKPTITVFTVTDSVLASDYPSAISVMSQLACSPCGQAQGPCPLGHRRCIAHDDTSVSPRALLTHIEAVRATSSFV